VLTARYAANAGVELDVVRGDERRTVKVELGERPERAPEQP